jgi:hypothetical protein
MEQRNDNLRERLLSRLPQPENLPRFQQETASLMARHERALFWERWTARIIVWLGMALYFLRISAWGQKLPANPKMVFIAMAALLVFGGAMSGLEYVVNRAKVDTLKEIKQIQIQLLELQARLDKTDR